LTEETGDKPYVFPTSILMTPFYSNYLLWPYFQYYITISSWYNYWYWWRDVVGWSPCDNDDLYWYIIKLLTDGAREEVFWPVWYGDPIRYGRTDVFLISVFDQWLLFVNYYDITITLFYGLPIHDIDNQYSSSIYSTYTFRPTGDDERRAVLLMTHITVAGLFAVLMTWPVTYMVVFWLFFIAILRLLPTATDYGDLTVNSFIVVLYCRYHILAIYFSGQRDNAMLTRDYVTTIRYDVLCRWWWYSVMLPAILHCTMTYRRNPNNA